MQFMTQLYDQRVAYVNTLDNLSDAQKLDEAVRQRSNLHSKQLKLNRRRRLTEKEERQRRRDQAVAEAEAALPPLPPTPPGTRPPSPDPEPYIPIQHPDVTPEDVAVGQEDFQTRVEIQADLLTDPFENRPVVGNISGILNTFNPFKSNLTIANNTVNTFSIWSAVSLSLHQTQNYTAWPSVKANIIKYFFRVMGDASHPRHRVYHVLQKRSELYPDSPDLTEFLLNNDIDDKPWSMDPGLWTIIADFYEVEVVVIRSREVFPENTEFPLIYDDDDVDRKCDYFAVVRGIPNPVHQVILYFTQLNDGSEQAYPVTWPLHYSAHERDPNGVGLDLSNRIDAMPWASPDRDDPAKQQLQHLTRLMPPPQNDPPNTATPTEELQLVVLRRDLSYMAVHALDHWPGPGIMRSLGHIDTWSHEIRQPPAP